MNLITTLQTQIRSQKLFEDRKKVKIKSARLNLITLMRKYEQKFNKVFAMT